MKFKWIRESQYSRWGKLERGETYKTSKTGFPANVVRNWIDDGWAEEIKPPKAKKSKNGGK